MATFGNKIMKAGTFKCPACGGTCRMFANGQIGPHHTNGQKTNCPASYRFTERVDNPRPTTMPLDELIESLKQLPSDNRISVSRDANGTIHINGMK